MRSHDGEMIAIGGGRDIVFYMGFRGEKEELVAFCLSCFRCLWGRAAELAGRLTELEGAKRRWKITHIFHG